MPITSRPAAVLPPSLGSTAPSAPSIPPRGRAARCVAFALAALLSLVAARTAHAGPVIIGGDDLPLHGCYSAGANQYGWLYIQKAMTRMFQSGCITRPNDGSIAALGVSGVNVGADSGFCAGSSDNGGSAIYYAAGVALGKTITYYNGASGPGSVAQFFADLASNTARPAVIWICSGYGDLNNEIELPELNVINANAAALAAFVNSGGGLMAHTTVEDWANSPTTFNQWLPSVVPGLQEIAGCNPVGAALTPAGNAAFPGLSNSDIDIGAGPCHTHFLGPIGSLQVLALDGDTNPNMYIIGGDCSTQICEQCDSPPDTCCTQAPTFSGVEHPALSPNLMVGTREAFGSYPYCVTVYDLGSSPPSPLEDKNWASITRFLGPSNSWNVDSLGSVFGLTVDKFGNIFVTHTSCYNFDYVGQVFGAGPGAVFRIDATTGAITTFCVLPNLPDGSVTPGSNFPGLGNITYDCRHSQFFVTNLEDGRIYRIKATSVNGPTGTVVQTFDPLAPDNGSPGWAPLGERLWGVQWHGDRVYYGVWIEDGGAQSNALSNEVRSVALFPGGGFDPSSDRHEVWLPTLPGQVFSNPVSDISFSANGAMLLAERGIANETFSTPHQARALEYVCSAGCWAPSPNIFAVGIPGDPQLCAGGVDYDRRPYVSGVLGRDWASADIMHSPASGYPDFLSGYQGLRPTGGSNLTSVLVDADGNPVTTEKTFIGDVEVVSCPGAVGTVCGQKFNDLNHNGILNGGEPLLSGWTIQLSGSGGTFTTTTDANGQYCFQDVPPGTYTLSEQLQAGWVQTAPPGSSYPLTVTAGQVTTGLDFGNYTCGVGGGGCVAPPPNMVAWWPFDETAGSTTTLDVTHQSPAKNVAQLFGAAAITAGGHTGRMLCVPGELDYAMVPNSNQLGLSFGPISFAIDAWVRMNPGTAGPRMLVEKRVLITSLPYRTRGWALYFNGMQLYLEQGIGITTQIVPGPTVTASTWNHIAVSVDRSGAGRWYLNGVLAPAYNFAPLVGGMQSGSDLYIGHTSPPFPLGQQFDGCIDDLEIFAAPLTAQSVLSLYTAGAAGKCPDILRLPEVTSICSGRDSVLVCFNVCNTSAVAQSYHWSIAGLPIGAGCTVNGPASFSPSTGAVTIAPGNCSAPICVTIQRPAGLTAQNATSCFQLTVVNDSTGNCIVRPGTIRADNTCWCAAAGTTGLVNVPGRLLPGVVGIPVPWGVSHPCGGSGSIPYRVIPVYEPAEHPDPQSVSLNGLPPGEPVFGTLDAAKAPTTVEVLVSLPNGYDAAAYYTIVLEADTDGDGVYERIGSTPIVATYEDGGITGVTEADPEDDLRLRVAPNPFTSGSSIGFSLARGEGVDLGVFDASGRLVRRLVRGKLAAGKHLFEWNGRATDGREAAIGIYFVRLHSESRDLTTKVVKLRGD